MSRDFTGFLQRLQGCAVSVVTWDHARLLGTLESVSDDCIRMTGVVRQDSHETGGWGDRLLIEDLLEDRGNQWPEIIIQRNVISTVTLVDESRRSNVTVDDQEDSSLVSPAPQVVAAQDEIKAVDDVIHASLDSETVCVEIGISLIELTRSGGPCGKSLFARMTCERRCMEEKLGFQIHAFRFSSNLQIAKDQFRILIHGTEVCRGTIEPQKLLAIVPENTPTTIDGDRISEPAFGLTAVWIDSGDRTEAERQGCTVVDGLSVIITALSYHARRQPEELLTYDAVAVGVDLLSKTHPVTVSNLIPHPVSLRSLYEVLRCLVAERVTIQHLLPIVESVARHVEHAESMQALVACVRKDIPLILCGPHTTESRNFPAIQLSFDAAEQLLKFQADKHTDNESPRSIFIKEVKRLSESMPTKIPPVIITSDSQREPIWNLFRRAIEDITVLSTQEISVIRPEILLTIDRELLQPSDVNAISDNATEEIRVRKPR